GRARRGGARRDEPHDGGTGEGAPRGRYRRGPRHRPAARYPGRGGAGVIVDFHTHLLRWEDYVPDMRDFIVRVNPGYLEQFGDRHPTPREFGDHFRAAGVDRVVVLAEHAPATTGNLRSEYVAEFCAGDDAL